MWKLLNSILDVFTLGLKSSTGESEKFRISCRLHRPNTRDDLNRKTNKQTNKQRERGELLYNLDHLVLKPGIYLVSIYKARPANPSALKATRIPIRLFTAKDKVTEPGRTTNPTSTRVSTQTKALDEYILITLCVIKKS